MKDGDPELIFALQLPLQFATLSVRAGTMSNKTPIDPPRPNSAIAFYSDQVATSANRPDPNLTAT